MTHQVSPMGTFFTPALPGMAYDILCLFAYTPVSEALVLVLFLLYHLFLDLNNDRFVSDKEDAVNTDLLRSNFLFSAIQISMLPLLRWVFSVRIIRALATEKQTSHNGQYFWLLGNFVDFLSI